MFAISARRCICSTACVLFGLCFSAGVLGQVLHESAKLSPSNPLPGDQFGFAVSVSGDVTIVGAIWDNDHGPDSRSAHVFRRSPGSSTWIQEQKLIPSDGWDDDGFGCCVAVSGDVAVVGAFTDDDNGTYSGSAYVFRWNPGLPGWVQEEKLLPSDGIEFDQFGSSVSVSGDVVLIGAVSSFTGPNLGSAYVFRWNGSSWIQEQKLLASDGEVGDGFGGSLSIHGDWAVIGAVADQDNGRDSGSAYVFERKGTSWSQVQKLLPSDGAEDDQFGVVSICDDVIAVGASFDDDNGSHSGSAYVFRRNGPSWEEEQKLLPADGVASQAFGSAVAILGDAVVIGAPGDDDNGLYSGSAYVFRHHPGPGGGWVQEHKLIASDGAAFDGFGAAVAMSGDTVVLGAMLDDDNGGDSGAAYIFSVSCDAGRYGPTCLPCPGGTGSPCNDHGTCDDGVDGTGACVCNTHWSGSECGTDVDECSLGNDSCNANATCTNTVGSFICTCNVGYSGDGVSCAPGAIPTISTWGLAILALALLVGSKIRHHPPMSTAT